MQSSFPEKLIFVKRTFYNSFLGTDSRAFNGKAVRPKAF